MMTFREFLKWARASDDVIAVRRIYIDMAGDLASGVLLSQIIYWHTPDEHGKPRMKIVHDGHLWIARSREEWWQDCRLTAKQVDRCLPILRDKGFIITRIIKFMGAPTTHVRINEEAFMAALDERMALMDSAGGEMKVPEKVNSNSTNGETQSSAGGEMNLDERGSSISTEIPSEITQREPALKSNSNSAVLEDAALSAFARLDDEQRADVQTQMRLAGRTLSDVMWDLYGSQSKAMLLLRGGK